MRTPRKQCESDTYHVISRGIGRHVIFEDAEDKQRYLDSLHVFCTKESVTVYAWCLMDNHIHLLLKAPMESISAAMRKLNATYAQYFNRIYDRVGHLFQDRFKSEPVESDEYFLTVLRYIHQNPQKAGIATAENYPWSSYGEYIEGPALCNTQFALEILGSRDAFVAFHGTTTGTFACMSEETTYGALSTEMIREIATDAIGASALEAIATLPKNERNSLLAQLKQAGLSVRQLERLTGLGRGIIQKAK